MAATAERAAVAGAIIERVRRAGVVGAGGAGFPAHLKLRARVDTVIANGAECEPLLWTDRRLLEHQAAGVVRGLGSALVATGASRAVVATKRHYQEAAEALRRAVAGTAVELVLLGDYYPAGDEQQLTWEVAERVVPEGGIPPDVGVLVQNVGTLAQIDQAVEGRPVTARRVTVAGAVARPQVLAAPLGTPFADLVAAAGPLAPDWVAIDGGPMMGRLAGRDEGVRKTTSGVVVLPAGHDLVRRRRLSVGDQVRRARSVCDRCRICTDHCPRFLLGHRLEPAEGVRAVAHGRDDLEDEIAASFLCCLCDVCAQVCPTQISPRSFYLALREGLRAGGARNHLRARPAAARPERAQRLLPVRRFTERLGLMEYDRPAEWALAMLAPPRVALALRHGIGAPATAVVRPGDAVRAGDLVGDVAPDAVGARVHASIDGRVAEVGREQVVIERG